MELDVMRVRKYIDQLRERQEKAERNYRDTGYDRYYNTMCKNQTIADALEQVLKNQENIDTLNKLKKKIHTWDSYIDRYSYANYEAKKDLVLRILADIQETAKEL